MKLRRTAILILTVILFGCTDQRLDIMIVKLGSYPSTLGPMIQSDGRPIEQEVKRNRIYTELYLHGETGVRALRRGLRHDAVLVRQNAALALGVLSSGHYAWEIARLPPRDISSALPELKLALNDADSRVRSLAAQAIGRIGPRARSAVPELVAMLGFEDEASRNTACIALRDIGPAAVDALPALRATLSDPRDKVRQFAAMAIDAIERD